MRVYEAPDLMNLSSWSVQVATCRAVSVPLPPTFALAIFAHNHRQLTCTRYLTALTTFCDELLVHLHYERVIVLTALQADFKTNLSPAFTPVALSWWGISHPPRTQITAAVASQLLRQLCFKRNRFQVSFTRPQEPNAHR